MPPQLWPVLQAALDSHPHNTLIQCQFHADKHCCGFLVWKLPRGLNAIECPTPDALTIPMNGPYVGIFPQRIAHYFYTLCTSQDAAPMHTPYFMCKHVTEINLLAAITDNPHYLSLTIGGSRFFPATISED